MSNNSYPCPSGGEIGRAQVAQAWACGLQPEPAMNPILLKPNAEGGSQVIVKGKLWKNLSAREYYREHDSLRGVVAEAYEDLASRFDVVVMEGAGSVAELNLRGFDLANLDLVTRFHIPWLLVSDIERGGVFASILGTIGLLRAEERSLLRAFAVNKFRGDRSLFEDGQRILEERSGHPCLGVCPYAPDLRLDDEDSLSLPQESQTSSGRVSARCAILRFPRISNTTDFRLLTGARWVTSPIAEPFEFIFLPGTKNTIADLAWLRSQGLAEWLCLQHQAGATIIGICGGFQMLGTVIRDPLGMESESLEVAGLGFLPVSTTMLSRKTTRVVQVRSPEGFAYPAYEIHLGETEYRGSSRKPFAIFADGSAEGMRANRVLGTYLHGAFEDPQVLRELGIPYEDRDVSSYSAWADWFEPFGDRFEQLFL